MRHSNSGKKLSRNPSHRKALFRNLAKALLTHGKIRTTEIKAKELRRVVEPLITLALRNDLHARRQAYRVLGSHQLVKRLFDEIGPAFVGVPGGYTRVMKLATRRRGDNAPMAIIELTRGQADGAQASTPGVASLKSLKPTANPVKTSEEKPAEVPQNDTQDVETANDDTANLKAQSEEIPSGDTKPEEAK